MSCYQGAFLLTKVSIHFFPGAENVRRPEHKKKISILPPKRIDQVFGIKLFFIEFNHIICLACCGS
jgi:hypothetical protein